MSPRERAYELLAIWGQLSRDARRDELATLDEDQRWALAEGLAEATAQTPDLIVRGWRTFGLLPPLTTPRPRA